jgi:hypothetical protein
MCVPHTNNTCCDLRMLQGFYCVWPDQPADMLVVGPYQGSLGCLRIPFGKGVCGVAASSKQTQLVPYVHAFPGHIACASRWEAWLLLLAHDLLSYLVLVLCIVRLSLTTIFYSYLILFPPPLFPENGVSNYCSMAVVHLRMSCE